jgi:hypothetical protein
MGEKTRRFAANGIFPSLFPDWSAPVQRPPLDTRDAASRFILLGTGMVDAFSAGSGFLWSVAR